MAPKGETASELERKIKAAKAAIEFEEDPHRAAIEDNPEYAKVDTRTWASIFFLAMSFGPPVGLSFMSLAAVVVSVSGELADPDDATGGATLLPWIVGSWSLSTACSFSLAGPLSDVFGRRNPILAGNILAIIGFILGACAKKISHIIAAEGLIGLGTGLIFVAYAGVPEMIPNKWRSVGLGILEGGISIPWGVVSTLLGAALTQEASWRWLFYISIIVQVIAVVGIGFCYWPTSRPKGDYDKTIWQQAREIDYFGLFLIIGGLASFLIGLTWADNGMHTWDDVSVWLPIVIGFLVICVGFAYEFKWSKVPMFPWSLFRMFRAYTILLVVLFVSGMNFHAMAPLLPQGSLYLFNPDGIQIGLIALPNTIMQGVAGVLCPMFAHKIGHVKWQLVLAMFLQTVFLGASAGAVFPNNKVAYMILPALGVPMFLWVTILGYAIASLHVPHSMLGVAMGLLGTFRSAGGAVGNAIFTTIFNSKQDVYIPDEIIPVMVQHNISLTRIGEVIPAAIQYDVGVPSFVAFANLNVTEAAMADLQTAVRAGIGHSLKIVFLATIPFSFVALALSVFIKDPTKFMTNHVQFAMNGSKEIAVAAEAGEASGAEVIGEKGSQTNEKITPVTTSDPGVDAQKSTFST